MTPSSKLNERASSPASKRISSPNADHEIRSHDLDILNPLAPSLEPEGDRNNISRRNVPVVKSWIGGKVVGHIDGMSVNSLNQYSLETIGQIESLVTSDFESADSIDSDAQSDRLKFDSKAKSKFYNSLLRNQPAAPKSPTGLPLSVSQAKQKNKVFNDESENARNGESISTSRRGSRIIAWPDEDVRDAITAESSGAEQQYAQPQPQPPQARLLSSTPILLPNLKHMAKMPSGQKLSTSHIKVPLRSQTGSAKGSANTFMSSTFNDGNSNISQRRHKLDASSQSNAGSLRSSTASRARKGDSDSAANEALEYNAAASGDRPRRPSDSGLSTNSRSSVQSVGSWADVTGREGNVYDVGPIDSESKDIASSSFTKKQVKALLRSSALLDAQQSAVTADLGQARATLLQDADAMVSNLPLKYLYSKPELRRYALQRAKTAFCKMTVLKLRASLKRAISIWKDPPVIKMNETQIGFMVISKRLQKMYLSFLRVKFDKWAFAYSSRYQEDRKELPNHAAAQIQIWWRDIRVTSRALFKNLWIAVKLCLQRRDAIRHMILFEQMRRRSIIKVFRAIQKRRRVFYAARSIIRNYVWLKLFRRTQQRLTRLRNVRIIQRFYRMKLVRHRLELHLITNVLRYGGYSVVHPKIPARFLRGGFLQSINMVSAVIQRAWFTSKGNYSAFIAAAARRAKEEHLQMLNDNALIIQHNWIGVLWKILNTTARQWNKARRISRAFRHYQYRCWMYPPLVKRRHKYARKIQRWYARLQSIWFLKYRFKARRALIMVFKRRQWEGAMKIQREFRAYKERERLRREAFIKLVEMQRNQAELVMKNITKIQRIWRKHLKGNKYARHVYLVMWRHVRKRRRVQFDMAIRIQRCVRPYIIRKKVEREEIRVDSANCIWMLGKAYCLKLAIWDRIMATRRIQRIAANLMKKNLRTYQWLRHLKLRCILRIYQKKYTAFRNLAASKMQRWFKRKWAEYYLPLREAGRLAVSKNRKAELRRCAELRADKAARIITRFFTPWNGLWIERIDSHNVKRALWRGVSWSFIRLVKARAVKERRYYTERKAAKKMQKFCKKVIAWARFDKIVAYRKKAVTATERGIRWIHAANVIGMYWYRRGEKRTLFERFRLRRRMLDEYTRLDKLKLLAYEERAEALRLKKITDDNMIATINASWKQGSDITGRNYYYNYVTGQTSWEPPEHYKAPVVDTWLRQVDDKGTVYYYNMFTGESSWLPPCVECGELAERYCGNCKVAFCEKCHERLHGEDASEEFQDHVWSLTEYSKEELLQGEVYCLECKKKAAAVTCLLCWDSYCKDCFKYTHAAGNLKYHPTKAYHKAKKGWMCIKSKTMGEPDYYMHGSTGVITYEKPIDLMSTDEKMYYDQYLDHRHQAESFIEQLKTLQFELEDAKYERDVVFQRALEQGTAMADILKRRKERKKQVGAMFNAEDNGKDTITEVSKKNKPSLWAGITATISEYRQSLLAPQPRKRNAQKSDYIKTLLESAAPT